MKDYTSNSPVFSETIRIPEPTDTNHADNFSPICTNFSGIPINQGLSASQTVQNIAKTL